MSNALSEETTTRHFIDVIQGSLVLQFALTKGQRSKRQKHTTLTLDQNAYLAYTFLKKIFQCLIYWMIRWLNYPSPDWLTD